MWAGFPTKGVTSLEKDVENILCLFFVHLSDGSLHIVHDVSHVAFASEASTAP